MGTLIPKYSPATFLVSPVKITANVSCAVSGSPTAPNTTYVTVLQGRNTPSTFRGNGDEKLYGNKEKDTYSDKMTSGMETILTECEILLMYLYNRFCCLKKLPVCLRPSRFGTFGLVCFNSVVDLLIGSAAIKVNALAPTPPHWLSFASVTFNHHHHHRLNPSCSPKVLLRATYFHLSVKHSPVVVETVYIHVSVRQSVKNIHSFVATAPARLRPFCDGHLGAT